MISYQPSQSNPAWNKYTAKDLSTPSKQTYFNARKLASPNRPFRPIQDTEKVRRGETSLHLTRPLIDECIENEIFVVDRGIDKSLPKNQGFPVPLDDIPPSDQLWQSSAARHRQWKDLHHETNQRSQDIANPWTFSFEVPLDSSDRCSDIE